jgi:smad nuclear-interacting protein 1
MEKSGKLNSNTQNGVLSDYAEPAEAQLPTKKWRLYVFKEGEALEPILIYKKSCYIFGRDHLLCDVPVDHPSISKRHCVVQYRCVNVSRDGLTKRIVK